MQIFLFLSCFLRKFWKVVLRTELDRKLGRISDLLFSVLRALLAGAGAAQSEGTFFTLWAEYTFYFKKFLLKFVILNLIMIYPFNVIKDIFKVFRIKKLLFVVLALSSPRSRNSRSRLDLKKAKRLATSPQGLVTI
jgi:hypothetical protein